MGVKFGREMIPAGIFVPTGAALVYDGLRRTFVSDNDIGLQEWQKCLLGERNIKKIMKFRIEEEFQKGQEFTNSYWDNFEMLRSG